MQKKLYNMKALILAAGKGTRLKELTADKPKALVKVNGVTLLERCINKLKEAQADDIIINIHHFGEQIMEYVEKNGNFGISITYSDERDMLLDTGGALKKAAWFFNNEQAFFIHNVDIISDINLQEMYQFHCSHGNMATLAVRSRNTSRYLLFNAQNRLCGRSNAQTNTTQLISNQLNTNDLLPMAFSGIHVISPQIFQYCPPEDKFSITDWYLQLASQHKIMAYEHNQGLWMDMGKAEDIHQLEQLLIQ